jgi:hypothetical protein
MINICAISDYNYLPRGLALYESLIRNNDDIVLHYLCADEKSYNAISKYSCDSLKVYTDKELLERDHDLSELKSNDNLYYLFTLASYFANHLMDKDIGNITYMDSDIFFYGDFQIILDEIGDKEIGMFRHRCFHMGCYRPEGLFNVGVVYFKNSPIGKECLHWWKDAVLHKKYPALATCGDQKYLEAFLELPKDRVFIDGDIGHGAPWQWQLYDYSEYLKDGLIIWGEERQELLFSHFSEFTYDLNTDSFVSSTNHHIYTSLEMYDSIQELKKIYEDYFCEIKNAIYKYSLGV